ncbi:hypothetical protein GQ457_04G024560 [Hibiscus cannabinus]
MAPLANSKHDLWPKGLTKFVFLILWGHLVHWQDFFTFNILISVAFTYQWGIQQIDVTNAFLKEDLHEAFYMHQPTSFEQCKDDGTPFVCKLIYGLCQAPGNWFFKLNPFLKHIGFKVSTIGTTLFVHMNNVITTYLIVYFDDILLT